MRRIRVNKPLFSIPLISPSENIRVDLEIYFFPTSEMISLLFCGSLVYIEIKCHVRTHESDSEVTVRQLGKIIQRIYFAQSGASIRTKASKWSGETHFPGALLLL